MGRRAAGQHGEDAVDGLPGLRTEVRGDDLADRVLVTPHLGAQTREAVDTMGALAVDGVLAVLAGRPPAHPVVPVPGGRA